MILEEHLSQFPKAIFQPEETVLEDHQDGDHLGYVETGLVKGSLTTGPGAKVRETVLVTGSRGWFGFECYVSGPNIIRHVAVNESVIRLVPTRWVMREASPEIRESLIAHVSEHWGIRTSFVADKSLTIEARILRWLIVIRQSTEQPEINLTHNDLADLAGVTRASVNPSLQSLQARDLVDLHHGHFVLPSLAVLRKAFQSHLPH